MFRTIRALILAVIVAASLLGSASVANADTTSSIRLKAPPALLVDITWE